MHDRTEPPPGYIVLDISTGPQCRQPWEFLAHDPKVGRVSRDDAIEGAWGHYDAVRGARVPASVRAIEGPVRRSEELLEAAAASPIPRAGVNVPWRDLRAIVTLADAAIAVLRASGQLPKDAQHG